LFFIKGGSILNTTISLMMTHDVTNGQQEQTATSQQQRQQGKGRLLQ